MGGTPESIARRTATHEKSSSSRASNQLVLPYRDRAAVLVRPWPSSSSVLSPSSVQASATSSSWLSRRADEMDGAGDLAARASASRCSNRASVSGSGSVDLPRPAARRSLRWTSVIVPQTWRGKRSLSRVALARATSPGGRTHRAAEGGDRLWVLERGRAADARRRQLDSRGRGRDHRSAAWPFRTEAPGRRRATHHLDLRSRPSLALWSADEARDADGGLGYVWGEEARLPLREEVGRRDGGKGRADCRRCRMLRASWSVSRGVRLL